MWRDVSFGGHDVLTNVFWTMSEMPFVALESKLGTHGWFPLIRPDSLKAGGSLLQPKAKAADPGEKLNNTDLLHDRAPLDRGEKSIKTKADCAALVFRYKMSSNCLPIWVMSGTTRALPMMK